MPDLLPMTFVVPAFALGVAFLVTLVSIPFVLRVAHRRVLLDHPDGDRHAHTHSVPRLGGVAVFAGFVAALVCVGLVGTLVSDVPRLPHALALLFASAILFGVGLLDDLYGVSPLWKLAGQTSAALVICASGFAVETISLPPNLTVDLGWMGVPITVLWLVGISNAFNLIDGLDGLAGGVGLVALAAIGVAAGILDRPFSAVCAAAMCGALLAFLRFNFPPARIFLGDSGSLTVGFILAYLSLRGSTRSDGSLLGVIPLFALAYPLLDTGVAMLRRWLRGQKLSRADSRHIHHQLRALGLTQRRAVALIYFHAAMAAIVGLFVAFSNPGVTVAVSAIAMVLLYFVLFGVRRLGYHEFLEAGAIMASALPRTRGAIRDTILARDVANSIFRAKYLREINDILRDSAPLFRFGNMQVGPVLWRIPNAPVHNGGSNGKANGHSNGNGHSIGNGHSNGKMAGDAPAMGFGQFRGHALSPVAWWNLDYPISKTDGSSVLDAAGDPLVLTLSCSTTLSAPPAEIERVAPVLAEAIRDWIDKNGERLRVEITQRHGNGRLSLLPSIESDRRKAHWRAQATAG